jgi:exopolysaccharide biosynthesis polyprenyl glycosylphosphotransferase
MPGITKMSKTSRKQRQLILLLGDVIIFYLALFGALAIRNFDIPTTVVLFKHVVPFSFAFIGWVAVYYTAGLYSLEIIFDVGKIFSRLGVSVIFSTLATAAMFYVLQVSSVSPKLVLILFSIFTGVLSAFWRLAYTRLTGSRKLRMGVAFVGSNRAVVELLNDSRDLAGMGYVARLVLDETYASAASIAGVPVSSERADLAKAVVSNEVQVVVFGNEAALPAETRRLLFTLLESHPHYMSLVEFYELVFRRLPIGEIDETWILENSNLAGKGGYLAAKRAIDIVVGLAIALLSFPLWPFIALGIAIESRGPIIFSQTRLGKRSLPFTIYKFRTMFVENKGLAADFPGDSRITRIGGFLRATRLDELPQMYNLIRGDMSFVGPRPERPELAARLEGEIPCYRQRLLVKPGLTGWDQVSGEYHSPSIEDTYKKLRFDLYYIKNLSLSLDVSVFFKTILTVLLRTGQ